VGRQVSQAGTDFVKLAKRDFNAQTISADFRDAKTAQRMSDWIGKHTKGMLRPEITIGRDEVMSVINTVYADGRWASPFESAQTTDARFHGTTDDHMVAMMHQSLELDGADGDGWHRADLPFDDGSRLKILLPDANRFESMCQDESTLRTAFEGTRTVRDNQSEPAQIHHRQ
jgi:serine protease inhibitor